MADFQTLIQNAFVDKALSSTNNWVNVGQITGTGQYANLSLNVVNTSPTSSAIISLAISNQASLPNTDDIIESNLTLAPNGGTLSRQNIIASVGEYVYVLANTDTVAVRMSGIIQALQSMEQLDSEILSLSAQQETDMSNINSLSAQQQTDMSNIATVTSQLAQDDQTLQAEINALQSNLNSAVSSLNGQIGSLSSTVSSNAASLSNQISSQATTTSNTTGSLQNQINALSNQLSSDNGNLQNQINSNQLSNLFTNIQAPSRGFGGTYYNQTGGPMFVMVTTQPNDNPNNTRGSYGLNAYVNGSLVANSGWYGYMGANASVSFMVPNGSSYQVNSFSSFGGNIQSWIEMTTG